MNVYNNPPVLPLLIKMAALGNLNENFHCAHLHSFFPLRKAPPLISVFFNSLYDPFGSPCRGQIPQGKRGNRPFNSLYAPFDSPCRGQKRCSNRFAIRLADHQRSTPCSKLQFFVRDEPALLKNCWWERRDTNKYLLLWDRLAEGGACGSKGYGCLLLESHGDRWEVWLDIKRCRRLKH